MNQYLDENEVEALLRETSNKNDDKKQNEFKAEVVGAKATAYNMSEAYDLTNPELVAGRQMPRLESINQQMARHLRSTFSSVLRRVVDATARPIQAIRYDEFLKTQLMPTSMHTFHISPLQGMGVLSFEPNLIFAMIESLLGGEGNDHVKFEAREFTAIESQMIVRVSTIIFEEMERAWKPIETIHIELVNTEMNPQFIGLVPPSDIVLVLPFEIDMEKARGHIMICLPYAILEPIRSRLHGILPDKQYNSDSIISQDIIHNLNKTQVEFCVDLGIVSIDIKKLLNLRVGDIICLDQNHNSELVVKVENIPKFLVIPCQIKNRIVLQVKRLIT